jgi:rod shape-determining protein MreD
MRWLVMIFVVIGGAIIQMFIPPVVLFGQAKVPFLVALVVYYALCHDTDYMLVAAFLAGLLQDVMSPIPLGYSSFCFCVIGLVAGRFRNVVMTESLLPAVLFGASAAMVAVLASYLLLVKDQLVSCTFWWLLLKLIGAGILGAVCAPVVFALIGRLDRMVGNVMTKEETVVLDIE